MHFLESLFRWPSFGVMLLALHSAAVPVAASCPDYAGAQEWTRNCSGTIWCESAGCYSCPDCGVDCHCDLSTCWCDSWFLSINVCWTWYCDGGGVASTPEREPSRPDEQLLSDPAYVASLGVDVQTNVRSECFDPGKPVSGAGGAS